MRPVEKLANGNGTVTTLRREKSEFGELVFAGEVLRQYLSESALEGLRRWEEGEPISLALADEIANGMRQWAEDRGATHYTHWFHPLTGLTAEKHEALYEVIDGKPLYALNGSELLQQEPDASSFPSGGLRSTFEARGYTAWDPTSPPFIYGRTLCIPSVYISFTGEALDYKVPLLRSMEALSSAALRVLKYFLPGVRRVVPTLGVEQEFFLIDREFYWRRPDLYLTGRTLIGAPSPRGQQMEDHYFGSIPSRVLSFFEALEREAWRLGIPLKTRHNEVAPAQYECAPTFEDINIAIDHNQLLMDLIQRVAAEHGLAALLHEKPFAGINGSGKHNNWSMRTDTGVNLLSPGKTPKEQFRFLVVLSIILRAIHRHAALLRATFATPGNEHRLGGNEAPPAILSVFLGEALSKAIDTIEATATQPPIAEKQPMPLNIPKIPTVFKDNTDRNRTSPFAFTGSKFELRAVGASAHCAPAMIVLNAAVAEAFHDFADAVEAALKAGKPRQQALFETMRAFFIESRPIRFDGNNYSPEWVEEAKRRGLPVIYSTPEAIQAYISPQTQALFTRLGILSETELHARYEVRLERYLKALRIELHTLRNLVLQYVLPAAINYQNTLAQSALQVKQLLSDLPAPEPQEYLLRQIQSHLRTLHEGLQEMDSVERLIEGASDLYQQAQLCYERVRPLMERLRRACDALEQLLPAGAIQLPSYAEMLFYL
jgi:glutamine synthetase